MISYSRLNWPYEECLETVVRGVRRSERLFFEPLSTSSILENKKRTRVGVGVIPIPLNLKESVVVVGVESDDPYGDFRRSMEDVVETYGVKDWKGLEELLGWYLRLNGKNNRGFIVLAFVDLLITLALPTTSSDSPSHTFASYCSAVSSFASSPIVSVESE
ncbi:Transcription repressor OFP13, partial [Mucuna pruriens]